MAISTNVYQYYGSTPVEVFAYLFYHGFLTVLVRVNGIKDTRPNVHLK